MSHRLESKKRKRDDDDRRSKKSSSKSHSKKDRETLDLNGTISIRKFDMTKLRPTQEGKRVMIVGMSGSGKTTVAKDGLRLNKDIPVWMIVSPSESRNHSFGPHVHPLWIHDDLKIPELENFKKRQIQCGEKWQIPNTQPVQYSRDPCAALVLDDCNIEPKTLKHDIFNWIYFNSRHDHVLIMMLTQYFMMVPIQHRRNISHLFLFRQNSPKEVKKIYDEFANMFPSFQDFKNALEICTSDMRCMVIDVLNPSMKIQDRVFWYKAKKDQPEFQVGAEWARKQSDLLYNENWKEGESSVSLDKQPSQKKSKTIQLVDAESQSE